jgi:hypothetical protein
MVEFLLLLARFKSSAFNCIFGDSVCAEISVEYIGVNNNR